MIDIILGGQYGSCGKGSVASVYAANYPYDLVIRTGSPNAGHTFRKPDGSLVKMRQLPVSWFFARHTPVLVPAGAVVDKDVLLAEAKMLRTEGFDAEVFVSPMAAVIQPEAKVADKKITTGTTGEGVGTTRADKCLRRAVLVRDDPDFESGELASLVNTDTHFCFLAVNSPLTRILIEGTQGFALSMDLGTYPYCTSTNLTPYRILDDAGIPFGVHDVNPCMVVRTFPIRIAGNSGPMYKETSWEELRRRYGDHIPIEQTTVTKKTRRVGEWDSDLVYRAARTIRPTCTVLTFADYIFPDIRKTGITDSVENWLHAMETGASVRFDWLGIGIGEVMTRDGEILTSDIADYSRNTVTDDDGEA